MVVVVVEEIGSGGHGGSVKVFLQEYQGEKEKNYNMKNNCTVTVKESGCGDGGREKRST